MITIQKFIKKHNIKLSFQTAFENPNMDNANMEMDHFQVKLTRYKTDGKQLIDREYNTYFSMGIGHRKYTEVLEHPDARETVQKYFNNGPTCADVLDCLASDCAGIENADNFEQWAEDYGYDTDSRKAEKIYNICKQQAEKFKAFMGDEYETLLYEVERL